MTVQCCKCKCIRRGNCWLQPDACLLNGGISHTYCPVCAEVFHLELFSSQASRTKELEAQRLTQHIKRGLFHAM